MKLRTNSARGFTLIEVMIVVAIVAILAAIAYPSYVSYIRKGKRATAQAALMDLASKEQTYLLDRRVYTDSLTTLGYAAPTEIQSAYTFTIACSPTDCSTPTDFTGTATPIGNQAVSGENNLTISATGAKTPTTSGYWGN